MAELGERIEDGKLVELKYRLLDAKTGQVLSAVEFPLNYIHGQNDILMPEIMQLLTGKRAGETIMMEISGDDLFGKRDESLVVIERPENVPEEYRKVGLQIMMQNEKGDVRPFYVTYMDDEKIIIDGNSPFSGRELVFELEILNVRDATPEEIEAGGIVRKEDINLPGKRVPLQEFETPPSGGGKG